MRFGRYAHMSAQMKAGGWSRVACHLDLGEQIEHNWLRQSDEMKGLSA